MADLILSPSDSFAVIATLFIIAQLFYLTQKLFIAKQLTGRFTWKRFGASFKPRGWGQRIFQWFVLLLLVRDLLHFFFSPRGLPLSSLLFLAVMILFVLTATMDRYQETGKATVTEPAL